MVDFPIENICFLFSGVDIPDDGVLVSAKDIKICTGQIKELILNKLNTAIAGKLTGSVDVLRDSYTGQFFVRRILSNRVR